MASEDYKAPTLTVDCVIFQLISGKLHVLVIKRASEPFAGRWALPGGYCWAGETTHDALARIIKSKSGITTSDLDHIEQLYTFDTVARDPRGHAVSVTYMGLGRGIILAEEATGHTPRFTLIDELPELAFDHAEIVAYAHKRLVSRINDTNGIFALLPEEFTLSQLQQAYEVIIGKQLDKRNFRKKYLSLNLIHATDRMFQEGAHRPARMYRFNQQKLQALVRSFD